MNKGLLFLMLIVLTACSVQPQINKTVEVPVQQPQPTPVVEINNTPEPTQIVVNNTESFADKNYVLQNKQLTPSALNPEVTQETINTTICVAGYTTKIRPSTSWSNPRKITSMEEYGINVTLITKYQYDHLIPLELGGCANCTTNMWPEPYPSANIKDTLENKLKKLVCEGNMTLKEAQDCIVNDWYTCAKNNGVVFPKVI